MRFVHDGDVCTPRRHPPHPSRFRLMFRPRLARLGRIPGPAPLSSKCSLNKMRSRSHTRPATLSLPSTLQHLGVGT